MTEIWNPIPGIDFYEVSNLGRVRSLDRIIKRGKGEGLQKGRVLKPQLTGTPGKQYHKVRIAGVERLVHRLVLEAFVGPCPPGMETCHGNGNRLDNRLNNLRWDTSSNNERDKLQHGTHHNARKTHCKNGHEFTPENTLRNKAGNRQCRACHRDQGKKATRLRSNEDRARLAAYMYEWRRQTGRVDGLGNRYARRTHCDNGHEFTPENTAIRSDGGRRCRACRRAVQ